MTAVNNLPDYQALFGDLDFKTGDPARSVHSPAAYLADLLQLVDDVFTDPDLRTRRPDIAGIDLDADRTFSLVPYLDIVNEQLERLTVDGGRRDAYDVLRRARYPLGLPFDLDDARVRLLLGFLAVSPDEIRRLFAQHDDPVRNTRDALGLSETRYRIVVEETTVDQAFMEANFPGIPAGSGTVARSIPVGDVLASTGLSGLELRELLGALLSDTARNAYGRAETDRASELFVNHGLGGFVQLDDDEEYLVWSDGRRSIDAQWFDRAHRLIRLAQWTGRSLTELDRFLRCCCRRGAGAPTLDATALATLAVATRLADAADLDLATVGVLFGDVDDMGLGDGDRPDDPFNIMFNGRHAETSNELIVADPARPGATYRPLAYSDMDVLRMRGDVLAIENKGFRRRISRGLGISEAALVGIVDGLRAHWADRPDDGPLDVGATIGRRELSLLARIVALCEVLDLAHTDLFALLGVLERDPSIRRFSNLALLVDPHPDEMDCFRILEGDDAEASIWLVQTLAALTGWIAEHDLTAEDLAHTTGATADVAEAAGREDRIAFYDSLVAEFAAHALTSSVFDSVDQRTARLFLHAVVAPDAGLVCPDEARIVRFEHAGAVDAAHSGLAELDVVHDDDFIGIGLGDGLVDAIIDQLIIRGVIDPDGVIHAESVPASADDFAVTGDFAALRRPLFDLIHAIHRDERASTEPGDPVEMSVYESDLAVLGASDAEVRELYRSLMHQGYIGASGEVVDPDLFAEHTQLAAFSLDSPIAPFASALHAILADRLERFQREALVVDAGLFAGIDLPGDPEGLIENLRFNGYLDEHDVVVDKTALEGLDVTDFSLALEFYPRRHAILAALVGAVDRLRMSLATVGPEELRELGEHIASSSVAEIVRRAHCTDGRLTRAAHAYFLDRANLADFELNRSFDGAAHEAVFDAVARFITSTHGVRLTHHEIDAIGLDPAARAELVAELSELDVVDDLGRIPRHRLDEFANANNALAFRLPTFPDDSMDVFFVLHAIAVETLARIESVVRPVEALAARQSAWLLAALQDRLEINADVAEVVGRHVFGTPRLVEAWMVPLLNAVDADGRVRADPADRRFRDAARRTSQFAVLAVRLGLDAIATEVVFRDQGLEEKFPEPLHLPSGIDGFDALIELDVEAPFVGGLTDDPPVSVICIFRDDRLWAYASDTRELVVSDVPLSFLSPAFSSLTRVDAAFTDADGSSWIIGGSAYWTRAAGDEEWNAVERSFGDVQSNFTDATEIDAAFVDHEGRTYLFVGDQYVRYSGSLDLVDEGYPRQIAGNWARELEIELPQEFLGRIDAAVQSGNTTYMFLGDRFVSSDDPTHIAATVDSWGVVRNNLAATGLVDAALSDGARFHLYSGDQVLSYSNSIENDGVLADEGSVRSLEDLPAPFRDGLDAAFRGADGSTHVFAGEQFASGDGDAFSEPADIRSRWGRIRNVIQERGSIDAALTGLDGRTYLFSGDQYVRYSGSRYTSVDEGYPKSIGPDWGGLERVDAAVVLDGKTYLFGAIHTEDEWYDEGEEHWRSYSLAPMDMEYFDEDRPLAHGYVRYSTNDYSTADEGYPKATDDNWWNLPDALVSDGFANPDAVFVGDTGEITLFSDGRFIRFDALHRWWSEPLPLTESWDSIPFDRVEAAFTGKDGRSYLFSGESFIRYTDSGFTAIDDRYPKSIAAEWGIVNSAIDRIGSIDAAVVTECVDGECAYTYLFCDRQFYRYTTVGGSDEDYGVWVDEGYPRTIATALAEEPRLTELTADLSAGVTAAAADRRTVYLIGREQAVVHAVSDRLYQEYPLAFGTTVGCAVIEHGVVYVESDGWHRAAGLEGELELSPSSGPPGLRGFPDDIDRPDAVLIGTDGAVYAFDDGRCHDNLLDRTYPTGEEWGRERNRIEHDGRVDAAFTGRDGMLHLFRGDEFVTYSLATGQPVPATVDGLPRPIADQWGGLTDVHLAFVRGESTFLLEHPDNEGRFRYVRYSGDSYDEPDEGFPTSVDHSWWEIPAMYVEEGFDRVDAVLTEGDDLFLIKDEEFVHFDVGEQAWTYPRPVERVWRNVWTGRDRANITAAFDGPNLTTTFFLDDGSYVTTEPGGVAASGAIAERWGVVHNLARTGRVDAALAHPDGTTYLFSGGQYVRYSGSDYRFVDEGYPKQIVDDLRSEAPFANLPDDLMQRLDALFETGGGLDAVFANGRTTYLVELGNLHVCSQTATAEIDVSGLGGLKNNLAATGIVDAALRTLDGKTYFFSGDQYVRYSDDFDVVDDGFPRSLMETQPGCPAMLKVDAAFAGSDGTVYLCSGPLCAELDTDDLTWSPIVDRWGRTHNNFTTTESNVAIDAAFVAADGSLYVFKDNQYVRHTNSVDDVVIEGYPRAIVDDFGHLPVAFEAGVHGGFTLDGRAYLSRHGEEGREYVRFSDPALATIDSIYPQPFGHRWGDWTDFLLTDLHSISRFVALDARNTAADSSLAELLTEHVEPYSAIAELFGWDVDEVIWLKRMNAFLVPENPFETAFDLEIVLKMTDVFGIAQRMESAPRELFELVWRPLFEFDDLSAVGRTLEQLLGAGVSEADWEVLERQIHDEMNTIRRDALLPYVVSITDDVETSRDLYEQLLLDPEVESCSQTSRVKDAITAVQLYLHRYFVNLEELDAAGDDDDMTRRRLKQWWRWMRNYRVWEANRKVFLYPENYLRPELRDTKTPAFTTLEEDLLQGELDDTAVQHAYRKYLDHYTEVSRLQIAGGYVDDVDDRPNDKRLVLFGRTKTDPRQYFYRTAVFPNGESDDAVWSPWIDTKLQIDSSKVYPVHAFGRLFVFWATVEQEMQDTDASSGTMKVSETDGGDQELSNTKPVVHVLRIWYSFQNLNQEWVPPQALDTRIDPRVGDADEDGELDEAAIRSMQMREPLPISAIRMNVEKSAQLDEHNFDNIVINCGYEVVYPALPQLAPWHAPLPQRAPLVRHESFALTPELYSRRARRPDFDASGVHVLRDLFPGEEITESRVVSLDTHEDSLAGPWFSLDHKGGSFLVKPQMPSARITVSDRPGHYPEWPRIDAAFAAGDTQYFFNNASMSYATSDAPDTDAAIGRRWGLKPSAIQREGRVDAALHLARLNQTFLFRGSEYIEYKDGDYGRTTSDSPSERTGNPNGFPEWDRLDAAFEAPNEQRFFFDNKRHVFAATNSVGGLGATSRTADRWGKVSNAFTRRGGRVTAAFEVGEVVLPGSNAASNSAKKVAKKKAGANKKAAKKKAAAAKKAAAKKAAAKKGTAKKSAPKKATAATKIAGRTKRGAVYLISGEHFVRYRDQLNEFVDEGYPKTGGAKAILEDIGFTEVDESLAGIAVEAAYRADDVLHLYLPNRLALDCDMSTWTISSRTYRGDPINAAYQNNTRSQQLLRSDRYDATLATGGRFYVFKGAEFMDLADVPASFDSFSWQPHGKIAARFGREETQLAKTGVVDAAVDAVVDGVRHVYLVSGGEYARYSFDRSGKPKPFVDAGYPKLLKDNDDGLPNWGSIGASFRARDGRSYYFESDGARYAVSTDLDKRHQIRRKWGLIPTDVSERGVAAAYVDGDKLFLISQADPKPPVHPWWWWWSWAFGWQPPAPPEPAPEYVRYTLRDGQPGPVIDEGYPRRIDADIDRRVTSAFALGQQTYLVFDGGYYAAPQPGSEPSNLPVLRQLKGNWGNLPIQFASEMNAALAWSDPDDEADLSDSEDSASVRNRLTLFSEGQTITYELGSGAAMPYEIDTAKFDVTRLTTSTGYVLNQRLFTGGLDALLDRATQYTDEVPALDDSRSTPTRIRFDSNRIEHAPIDSHLDFFSANGIYYWEVFFHAPTLIAGALNTAQRFEDAKRWYEFVYDPTEPGDYWGFLPFVGVDIDAIDASARRSLDVLEAARIELAGTTELTELLGTLLPMADAFRGERQLDLPERRALRPAQLRRRLAPVRSGIDRIRPTVTDGAPTRALDSLGELAHIVEGLNYRHELLQTGDAQLRAYLDDPFDPHAIAGVRRIAYRKAMVMAYVDNLLDWGDQLFGRYTMESISEARMLYVLAYDLLGRAPTGLGDMVLSPTRAYDGPGRADGLRDARDANTNVAFDPSASYDFLLGLEERQRIDPDRLPYEPTVHDSIIESYFYIPDNELFREYWGRVEDRLHKIRNCLNIMGVEQPLPLFQPPIDPMALVQAVGSGVPLSQVLAGIGTSIPHYRFTFMLAKARELTQKVSQFGNELLQTLEKRDAEELSMMQSRQEAVILSMTRGVREAQLAEVEASLDSLRETHRNAIARAAHYDRLISGGMIPQEISQLGLMAAGAGAQYASIVLKALGAATYLVPEVTVGLFSFGAKMGGNNIGDSLSGFADSVQTLGEALSMTGEALGVQAAFERMAQEWQLQKLVTASEIVQIEAQLRGAEFQRQAARREIDIMDREIEHNEAISGFMKDKFTNQQLYQWMAGRLSATYFQTYQLAHEMARYAEQAFRYERGIPERDVAFIQPAYWNSQRKGLTAGEALGLDIDRMEQSFIETDARRFEISRNVSLLEIDPLALMTLRSTGTCEFRLDESLFDYDFAGHYCRQIKTISLSFDHADGSEVMATLTQLNHHTVLQPEPKAVKALLEPSNDPPTSIRSDWRANQQVALSHVDEYDKNNGLFELRFDDDRYLPFEGTGAVSTWRLTMNGKRGTQDAAKLNDVIVNLKYSALEGGRAFGTSVRGLLKPYLTGVLLDVADVFPDAWDAFKANGTSELALSVSRDMFPDMSSSKVAAIYTHFDRQEDGRMSMVINDDEDLTLEHGAYLETTGLSVGNTGSEWSLVLDGDKAIVDNVQLVVIYKASVK